MKFEKICKHLADNFYTKYEHLGNCGLGVWHYGLFCDDELISIVSFGVTCFSKNRGIWGYLAQKYDVDIIQLTRGGTKFDAPSNIPSQIIKLSMDAIRKEFGNTLIVAYSDTKWNEIGTIYQACNFLYLGLTNPGGQCNYIINDKFMSGWDVRKKYGTRSIDNLQNMGFNVVRIPLNPKHRYLYINASRLKKKFINKELSDLTYEYPKRSDLSVNSMCEIREKLMLGNK